MASARLMVLLTAKDTVEATNNRKAGSSSRKSVKSVVRAVPVRPAGTLAAFDAVWKDELR